jgi:magnesium chelatase subunit I
MMDVEEIFEEIMITPSNAPVYLLHGEEVNIWDEPFEYYHSRSPTEYIREKILEFEKSGKDPFPDIVGKEKEKEMVKTALMSGSSILFKGKRGYGKTTFSKAIAKLLPDKLLAIKGCKIHDDPTRPTCFSCKKKVLHEREVELEWVPRVWVRIPGDPMMTTRQLIGGISIQKIREGYDLDHPEVFVPGRALKANRGIGYYDELGAIPTALQTLLHELFEEGQITTPEGDVVPFHLNSIEIASTNPANYRGTSPIKEPLLDRMEQIEIGPPESLEEEIEIGLRNSHYRKMEEVAKIPVWHMKILARIVRYARSKRCHIASKITSEPSCRATIKLYDHVISYAIRNGKSVITLEDYGNNYDVVKLALGGRLEVTYEVETEKEKIIEKLVEEAINRTCADIYATIPREEFNFILKEILSMGYKMNGTIKIELREAVERLPEFKKVNELIQTLAEDKWMRLSALEILLESIGRCTGLIRREYNHYVVEYDETRLQAM